MTCLSYDMNVRTYLSYDMDVMWCRPHRGVGGWVKKIGWDPAEGPEGDPMASKNSKNFGHL